MELGIIIIIFLAVILDILWGEPPVFIHPVVWMGKIINFLKSHLIKIRHKISGFLLTVLMIIIFTVPLLLLLYAVENYQILIVILSTIILSTTFSIKFLITSSSEIMYKIESNLEESRQLVSYLVSRDTSDLSTSQLISATVESLTENITDSVISPIFYAFIFGVPGAVVYRVVNTLDAMVGYKNEENILIGWFPAKLDDVLNYIPARITGLMIIFTAIILKMNWKNSYHIMMRDARSTPSPNSGYSMAAAAGALEIKLEKPDVYEIGEQIRLLDKLTIEKAIKLTKTTITIFLIISTISYILIYYLVITMILM